MNSYIKAYINADNVCPSGYYRISQYFHGNACYGTHPLMPRCVYSFWHSRSSITHKLLAPLVLMLIILRVTTSLATDLYCISRGKRRLIIIQRSICPKYLPLLTAFLLKQVARKTEKLIWDFDDNILDTKVVSDRELRILTHYASHIIVTSRFLADKLPEHCRDKVMLLPTTDGDMTGCDRDKLIRERISSLDKELRVVWVGTGSGNLRYVKRIIPALDEAACQLAKQGRRMSLSIVSNITLVHPTKHLELNNIAWTHDIAIDTILRSHVGIMPLQSNIYTLGKGGFKLIQYLSASLPVIASNVGYNSNVVDAAVGELLNDDTDTGGWDLSQYAWLGDSRLYREISANAYRRYSERFSYERNKKILMALCGIS